MNQEQRDLALDHLWAESLERSLNRRGRGQRTSTHLARLRGSRDLADPEHFADSLAYSRRRREAAESASKLPAPAARGISLGALLATTAGPAVGVVAASSGTAVAAPVVSRHTHGTHQDVARLQRALGVRADGIFGPQTLHALRQFQARHGLAVDGIAGPATWAALERAGAHTAVVAASSGRGKVIGHSVKALQQALGVPADGIFGPQTLRALKSFQASHGLAVDGIAGPLTWRALDTGTQAKSGTTTVSLRTTDPQGGGVAALQRALGITADGTFGPQTEAAVKQFQRSHGLTVDGVVGPATRAALHLGDGPALKRAAQQQPSSSATLAGDTAGSGGGGNVGAKVAQMVAAANRIATTPYIYGGGHGSFQSSGYDCSGSVSYVLHAAGLLSSPLDSTSFESYGAAGPGQHVTIYANAGHAWMTIDGRRFDTSAQRLTGGSRWTSQMRSTAGFVVRHPVGF